MCRRPDNRAAHGRHADAVRIGTTTANAATVNAPQSKGKRRGPFSPSRPRRRERFGCLRRRFPGKPRRRLQGSRVDCYVRTCRCKSDGQDVRRQDVPRSEERANRFGKARLRDKPPRSPSLPRRYVSAASPFFSSPFTQTLRSGVCLSPFFTKRETTLRPRPASTVTAAATSAAPTERRASAPRRRNKRGAFPTPARPHGRFLPSVYGEG